MTYTDEERREIAEAVRRTRVAQGLDKEPAARVAKVNSITWKRVEDGAGVRDASLSKILTSLGLPAADEILQAQPPEPSDPMDVDYLADVNYAAQVIKLIGDQLLAAIPAFAVADIAKALSELSDEYARTLLAAVEENPLRRTRLAEPYTAAVMAARHFRSIHDVSAGGKIQNGESPLAPPSHIEDADTAGGLDAFGRG